MMVYRMFIGWGTGVYTYKYLYTVDWFIGWGYWVLGVLGVVIRYKVLRNI